MALGNLPFDSREHLIEHLTSDMGLSTEDAEEVADVVMEEAESEEGNAKEFLQSIKNGAKSILSDIGLETVSWVENPSQDSMFVMMKNSEDRIKKSTSIYKAPEEEDWETVYGPVMRPNDIDKDGDVATASDIQKAAHQFIAEGRVKQFDTDHDLNTGKGTLVESWILKEDKKYELPNGESEVIEKGSWMVGVQPTEEVRKRIENGEITGWSIFGQADQISLDNTANFKTRKESNAFKDDTMSENQSNNDSQEKDLSMKDVHSEIQELKSEFKEYADSPEPTTVESKDELQKQLENLEKEDKTVVELSSDIELTSKEPEMEDLADLMDHLEDQLMDENFSMLVDAVRGNGTVEEGTHPDDEDEDEDMEMQGEDQEKEETEKAHYKANQSTGAGSDVEKSGSGNSLQPFKNQVEG